MPEGGDIQVGLEHLDPLRSLSGSEPRWAEKQLHHNKQKTNTLVVILPSGVDAHIVYPPYVFIFLTSEPASLSKHLLRGVGVRLCIQPPALLLAVWAKRYDTPGRVLQPSQCKCLIRSHSEIKAYRWPRGLAIRLQFQLHPFLSIFLDLSF